MRGRKRNVFFTLPLPALILGGVTYYLTRGLADPRLVGLVLGDIELVPRSRFHQKPVIDLPVLGGVQIPKRQRMPSDWTDDPFASGFLTWAGRSGEPIWFGHTRWHAADGTVHRLHPHFRGEAIPSHVRISYVFGRSAQIFHVDGGSGGLKPGFSIELPPMNWSPPAAKDVRVKAGDITLTFRREAWLGPRFAALFSVRADGLPGKEPIAVECISRYEATREWRTKLLLYPGRAAKTTIINPSATLNVIKLAPEPITIEVDRSRTVSRVTSSGTKSSIRADFFASYFCIMANDQLLEPYLRSNEHEPLHFFDPETNTFKQGTHQATAYRIVSRTQVEADNLLPKVPIP